MKVQAISFTGKTPKMPIDNKAYNEVLAKVFEHSDKDYINLTKKLKNEQKNSFNIEKFVEQAKKFFAGTFPQ